MKNNGRRAAALMIFAAIGLGGCSVINFFPRQAAERAADQVIGDILRGKHTGAEAMPPAETKKP